jgi:hypothetical protein
VAQASRLCKRRLKPATTELPRGQFYTFMVLGVPLEHEWLVPKLSWGTGFGI